MSTNPLGWAQSKLLGGPRRIAIICAAYAALVLVGNVFFYRILRDEIPLSAYATGSLTVLIIAEACLLIFVGASGIKKAIHRDFTSEMITSHRTTAMSGHTIVMGYLTGATITVLGITVINWLAATLLAQLSGLEYYLPTFIFIALGCLALLIWTFAALVALSTRGTTSVVGLLFLVGVVANLQDLFTVFPGLSILLNISTIQHLKNAGAAPVEAYVFVSLITQVALSAVFFLAAARKVARDDVIGMTPSLAYLLLAMCTLVSAIGLRLWAHAPWSSFQADLGVQCIVTLAALVMLAMLPVAGSARRSSDWAKRQAKDPGAIPPRPRSYLESPFAALMIVFTILGMIVSTQSADIFAPSGLAVHVAFAYVVCASLFALLQAAGLFRYVYAITPKAFWLLILFLLLAWTGPIGVDVGWEIAEERPHADPRSWLFGCSPIGTWILTCTDEAGPILPGLGVQALIAVGMVLGARTAPTCASRVARGRPGR